MDKIKNSVLVVDDESANIMALTHILGPEYTIYAAKSGKSALSAAERHLPDLILLDILMPEMDGYAVLATLKESSRTQNIPVVFATALDTLGDEERGLALGAADYITKPFSPAIVRLRVRNQMKILDQLRTIERLSMTDLLTNLPNRLSFDSRFSAEWGRAQREQVPISLLVIDVDKFKQHNDTYGHLQGDVALQTVAKIFTQELKRPTDFVARWGGEEFLVLLPNTDASGAYFTAEKIRQSVENTGIPLADGSETKITVSIGINTEIPIPNSSREKFISRADKALYKAKDSGRNNVVHTDVLNLK